MKAVDVSVVGGISVKHTILSEILSIITKLIIPIFNGLNYLKSLPIAWILTQFIVNSTTGFLLLT